MWLGVVFIVFSEKYVGGLDHDGLLKMDSFDAKKICVIMAAMTIHSFSEGVGALFCCVFYKFCMALI